MTPTKGLPPMGSIFHVFANYGYTSEKLVYSTANRIVADTHAEVLNSERDDSEVPLVGETGTIGTVKFEVIQEFDDGSFGTDCG